MRLSMLAYTLFRKTIATVETVFIAMYAPLMSFVLRRVSCTGGGSRVCDIDAFMFALSSVV